MSETGRREFVKRGDCIGALRIERASLLTLKKAWADMGEIRCGDNDTSSSRGEFYNQPSAMLLASGQGAEDDCSKEAG